MSKSDHLNMSIVSRTMRSAAHLSFCLISSRLTRLPSFARRRVKRLVRLG